MSRIKRLAVVEESVRGCRKCNLCETRTNIVFGVGSANADIMFVGEGPGQNEDLQGEPFVGRAGKLLDQMIEAMTLRREDVYIANIVKCRPLNKEGGNRAPNDDEAATCTPYLTAQIAAIRPAVIVALGLVAAHHLTKLDLSMTKMHGRVYAYKDPAARLQIPLVPTYHPAFLLRNPAGKSYAWKDLKVVMKIRDQG